MAKRLRFSGRIDLVLRFADHLMSADEVKWYMRGGNANDAE